MKQEEPIELTREEAVARWRKQHTKERAWQRLVFGPTLGSRLKWLLLLVIVIPLGFVYPPLSIIISCILGLLIIGKATIDGRKIIIDNVTGRIVVENRFFFFFCSRRVIPFSAVTNVVLDYKRGSISTSGSSPSEWKVSLDVGSEPVKIAQSKEGRDMRSKAYVISEFMGKEMIDNAAKSEPSIKRPAPQTWQLNED